MSQPDNQDVVLFDIQVPADEVPDCLGTWAIGWDMGHDTSVLVVVRVDREEGVVVLESVETGPAAKAPFER